MTSCRDCVSVGPGSGYGERMPSPEAVSGSPFPVHWAGRHAVIMLPAEIDIANARQAEDEIFALLV